MIAFTKVATVVGKVVLVRTNGPIQFEATIVGYRSHYSRDRWEGTPGSGQGTQYFESTSFDGPVAAEVRSLEVQS